VRAVQRAIVTGAGGFLGRHLVHTLERRGVVVTALTRRPRPGAICLPMGDAATSAARLADIVKVADPDTVFQLVGRSTGSDTELERANVGVTIDLMLALRDAGACPLLVCCGSAAEYGAAIADGVPVAEDAVCAPQSRYGASKLAQTSAVLARSEALDIPVVVARIFNAIGPGMPSHLALGDFAGQISRLPLAGVLKTGNLEVRRDFVDVEHVADALCKLAVTPAARGIVNVCSGQGTPLANLVQRLVELSGKRVTVEPEAARFRVGELGTVVGSTARLEALGAGLPATNHAEVMARIWRHATAGGSLA